MRIFAAWHQCISDNPQRLFVTVTLHCQLNLESPRMESLSLPESQPPLPQAFLVPVGQFVLHNPCASGKLRDLLFLHSADTFLPPCLCPAHSFPLKYKPCPLLDIEVQPTHDLILAQLPFLPLPSKRLS